MFHTLLADDSPFFRHVLRKILTHHFPFMLVCEAADGRRALMQGSEYRPQLIFIDIKLPDQSGLAVARQLKAANPAAAVCILTQHDIPEYRAAAQQCGADHFIAKDESSEAAIVALVEATISRRFRVFLLNHNERLRQRVEALLVQHWPAMVVIEATAALSALPCASRLQPDAVVLSQPVGSSGRYVSLRAIRDRHPHAELIIITSSGQAISDFVSPPPPALLVPQDESFGQRLVDAVSAAMAARVPVA